MKPNLARCSKKELRKQLESAWQKLAEADKKLTALEDRVRYLSSLKSNWHESPEKAVTMWNTINKKYRDCTGCTHYDNAANKPLSRQFCLTCSRRAKDKFECVCKNNDS